MSLDLNWALVQLPLLPEEAESWDNLNIVKTTSGNFSPILVDENEPVYGKPVLLATPGCEYGLRGRFMGSEAVVNIPVWVLRMEKPLLIELGDSGSWACDTFTGDLIGILVAGCPQLLEAYVIPAYRVFDDIRRRHIDMDFGLPRGSLLPRIEDRSHLSTFFKLFRDIEGKLRNIADTGMSGDWQGIKDELNKVELWRNGFLGRIADIPNQQELTREKDRDWTDPLQLLVSRFEWELTRILKSQTPLERFFETYLSLEHPIMEAEPEEWAKAVLRKPPRRRYDYMSKAWRDHFRSDKFNISIPQGKTWDPRRKGVTIQPKQVLRAIWDHLILEDNDASGPIDFESNKLDNIFDLTPYSSYSMAVPCYVTHGMPRDRLGLRQSLEVMTKDLEKTFDNIVKDSDIVANGIGPLPTVDNGGPVNLIGVVLTNEDGSRVAALLPPSSLGSRVSRRFDLPSSREIPPWIPEEYLERQSDGRVTFACSQLRLPLSVWDSDLTTHNNIKRLFRDHLQPQTSISDSDQFLTARKLDWNRDGHIYYFREQNRNVLIDFYEVILPVKESELQYTNSKGWIVTSMDRDEAKQCYDWDVPFFNVFQPTPNEDNENSTDNNVFVHAPTGSLVPTCTTIEQYSTIEGYSGSEESSNSKESIT
ncbi:hypothetical protein QBC43DRAFT_114057 [Cladorrhinum sp. PSN259]|nr:hypothetical protein QBC43DRAFT_114057 [Cladorrhinum sp. PSN259]